MTSRDRFSRPVATITNGFDPDSVLDTEHDGVGHLSSDRRSLVHTGTLSYGGRSIQPLLDAFRLLHGISPGAAETWRSRSSGPSPMPSATRCERAGMSHAFSLTGALSHDEAAGRPARRRRAARDHRARADGGRHRQAVRVHGGQSPDPGDRRRHRGSADRASAPVRASRSLATTPRRSAHALRRFAERLDELPRPSPAKVREFALSRAGGADGRARRAGADPPGRTVTAEPSHDPLVQSPAPGI